MVRAEVIGSLRRTNIFLRKLLRGDIYSQLHTYGLWGVDALSNATPMDSGLAANSWKFRIVKSPTGPTIEWYNTNTENGAIVVILIQYGHGTGTGGWVEGRDFINPAMRPIFDKIAVDVWKKVTS